MASFAAQFVSFNPRDYQRVAPFGTLGTLPTQAVIQGGKTVLIPTGVPTFQKQAPVNNPQVLPRPIAPAPAPAPIRPPQPPPSPAPPPRPVNPLPLPIAPRPLPVPTPKPVVGGGGGGGFASFPYVMQDRGIAFCGPSLGGNLPVFTPEFLTTEAENFKMQTESGLDIILEVSSVPPPPVFVGIAPTPVQPPRVYTPPRFFYAAAAGY